MADAELVIIGGGVAGLTAALFAARDGIDTVVVERMGTGGQMINADQVENFPGFPAGIKGYELAPLVAQQAMEAGVRVEYAEVQSLRHSAGRYVVDTDDQPFTARAVIIAAGSTLARLGVPGEAEFEGRGVSSCAVCDAEFFRDQPVVVVGGGDTAMDEALYLAEIASSVTVVHRRDQLRAVRSLAERAAAHPRIAFRWNTVMEAIEGRETVERVRLRDADGAISTLEAAGVFVYVGLRPNSERYGGLVELDAGGHIAVDAWMRTATPGVLAAGDIRQHSARQLVTVAGDGATAAIAAAHYLRTGEWR